MQLVERCRCLVDATPEAIRFTVDRVWKAADSSSSGQVSFFPNLLNAICCHYLAERAKFFVSNTIVETRSFSPFEFSQVWLPRLQNR